MSVPKKAGWYVYKLPPVDHGWHMALAAAEVSSRIWTRAEPAMTGPDIEEKIARFEQLVQTAQNRAAEFGWEGDCVEGPIVTVLPPCDEGDVAFQYAFMFKQLNDGATFVVTPEQLPWIDDECLVSHPKPASKPRR